MNIKIYSEYEDLVIQSKVFLADIIYSDALDYLYPLVDKFEAQRKLLDNKFYDRLERDILLGCVMPSITIAFVRESSEENLDYNNYIKENINEAYILDGIQRLNTLKRASEKDNFIGSRKLLLNIIISSSKDKLLYRMITLNNGQKPMTPRHQIEILTKELFDFKDLGIDVQSEKERSERTIRGAFNLGDISRGYLAFLTDNVHNENNKIINDKMDQILVGRILDSNITNSMIQFQDVLNQIDRLANDNEINLKWLKTSNNLIGFCVGIKASFDTISEIEVDKFTEECQKFEDAFKAINPSKVNLGKFRRQLSKYFIENIDEIFDMDSLQLIERFAEITA